MPLTPNQELRRDVKAAAFALEATLCTKCKKFFQVTQIECYRPWMIRLVRLIVSEFGSTLRIANAR